MLLKKPQLKASILIVLCMLMVTTACSFLYFYRSIHELPGMAWNKDDVQSFEVEVDEPTRLDGIIIIRHIEGFSYSDLPVEITINSNDQEIMHKTFAIPIKDDNGDYVGDGSVDLWDVNYPIFEGKIFEPGEIEFRVSHAIDRDRLPLIMEVGLQLEKSE